MDFKAAAVHGVNSFIWSKLQEDLGWTAVNGLVPITTPQETPEFQDAGQPYIIYNYSTSNVEGNYGIKNQTVVYAIMSPRESEVREGLNLVEYYLGGEDLSAEDVNAHVETVTGQPFSQFDYKSITAKQSTGGAPTEQEGGFMDSRFEFTIKYTSSRVRGFEPTV